MNQKTFFLGSNLNLLLVQLENKCNFFDSFGIFVQAILGLITIGILMCKKPFQIFLQLLNSIIITINFKVKDILKTPEELGKYGFSILQNKLLAN